MTDKSRSMPLRHKLTAGAAVVAVVIVWQVLGHTPLWLYPKSLDDASRYGDSFGYVNSLFSALAFLGIIATILLQRQELQLQREELEQTREELRRSAEAQDKSQAALREQVEWLSLAPYLNVLIAFSEQPGGRSGAEAKELLAEIVNTLQPSVIGRCKQAITERKREQVQVNKQRVASLIETLIAGLRQVSALRERGAESVSDACRRIAHASTSISEATANLLPPPCDDLAVASLGKARHQLTDLFSDPVSTPISEDEIETFWQQFDLCIEKLELARKALASP